MSAGMLALSMLASLAPSRCGSITPAVLITAISCLGCGNAVDRADGTSDAGSGSGVGGSTHLEPNPESCPSEPPSVDPVDGSCTEHALRCSYEGGACHVTYTCRYHDDDDIGHWGTDDGDVVCTTPPVECWDAEDGEVCALVGDACRVVEDHCYRVDATCTPDHTWALETIDYEEDDCL